MSCLTFAGHKRQVQSNMLTSQIMRRLRKQSDKDLRHRAHDYTRIILHDQRFAAIGAKLERVEGGLGAVGRAHFTHDITDMNFGSALAHAEFMRDYLVRLALLKLGENRLLPGRKPIGRHGRRRSRRRCARIGQKHLQRREGASGLHKAG